MPYTSRPGGRRHVRAADRAKYRRRRLTVFAAFVSAVVLLALVVAPGSSSKRAGKTTAAAKGHTAGKGAKRSAVDTGSANQPIPAVEAGVMPWTLDTALSRPVVLAGGGGSIIVAGGLNAAQASLNSIFSIDLGTGNRTVLGTLAAAVHDAAGAVIAGKGTVMAGGSPATVAAVQQFQAPPGAGVAAPAPAAWSAPVGSAATSTASSSASSSTSAAGGATTAGKAAAGGTTAGGATAGAANPNSLPGSPPIVITGATTTVTSPAPVTTAQAGQLPQPRSDHSAVTVGNTTYVIGGYDGTNPDAGILSTTDGIHYTEVGTLQVPVRYGAAVAVQGQIYLFGGRAVGGASDGSAVSSVQVFDPATGKTRIAGSLPVGLAGSSAFDLGGSVYVAGGVVNAAPTTPGGVGQISNTATNVVYAWNTKTNTALAAGRMPVAVAYGGSTVDYDRGWIVGGENAGKPLNSVEMIVPNPKFGNAGADGAGSPYYGYKLLVADRGNDRLQVLTPGDQIAWAYPSVFAAAPPGGFYFPDDAFFVKGGTEIVSNQERNHTIVIISFPSGQLLWQYGHPLVMGATPGYLSWPDDAYLLKDGEVAVADDRNCRILFINPDKTVNGQIGTNGSCVHNPPTQVASPNGATPLANGNYLISEINGQWISEYTKAGQLVWTTHLDMHYPSDPQQLGPDLYLISDYAITPGGAIDLFNREGQILYRYQPAAGVGRLNQNSLTELLPSGVFMTNDDYRDRMVAVDPATGALVWQYGVTDVPGTGPGYLNTPDGFDLLAPDGSTPTHLATG